MPDSKILVEQFFSELRKLKDGKGASMGIEDIGGILNSLTGTLEKHSLLTDEEIYQEIRNIAARIHSANEEVSSIGAEQLKDQTKDANEELDAVIRATENATNSILTAAEAIQSLLPRMDTATGEAITAQITQVFEACTFQDITGQRIRKVLRALVDIEERVNKLLGLLGSNAEGAPIEALKKDKRGVKQSLLNGPQLDSQTPSQDDIDKLFASL